MKSVDLTQRNIEKIAELFPNVITEVRDENGKLKRAVDFDLLKQELSDILVEGDKERYQLTWPGKKQAILNANTPIDKTLRPVKEDSVDWDNTQNLYIEGDNLEVLKLLQESYLNKIKCIYIDPPYNTGKDFIYKDDFRSSADEYLEETGQVDEEGNRLFQNTESNGRFHSDWLTMMYSRLKIARNLLRDDGVIFISIDDNELENLKKLCNEVFGENNFVACLPTIMNLKGNNDQFGFAGTHEYTLVYGKNKSNLTINEFLVDDEEVFDEWDEDEYGLYKKGANLKATGVNAPREKRPNLWYPIYIDKDNNISLERKNEDDLELLPISDGKEMSWRWSAKRLIEESHNILVVRNGEEVALYKKQRPALGDLPTKKPKSIFYKPEYSSGNGTSQIKALFGIKVFSNPKPTELILDLIHLGTSKEDIILDFFAGSSTTAHAVMQLNAKDGGNRKYIMVQLPEPIAENSEAYKAGYKNICEIGKERIRRAAKKIKDETGADIDYGFRVFRVDSSNMKDVYYTPDKLGQEDLFNFASNIKEDRTGEDLLIQVMLELGLELSLPMETKQIEGKTVHYVAGNSLVACFDEDVPESVIRKIAEDKPLRVVFRDSSFKDDPARINVEELFKMLSPGTEIQVL